MPEKTEEINFFAKTNFRNKEQPFGIKVDDRRRHFYTLGKTGMGKTSMIQNMAIQDIQNGNGVAIVDPHGEFAEECLKAVPRERIKDVIYFNPADLNFPVSLNVMERVSPEQRHLVSSGLIGIFKKLWADSWGPRLEYILRNAILALLCHPSSTLLGINRLLVDKQYREEVLSYVDDPVVSSYWIDEFSKYNDRLLTEAISPIQNKVGQFLSSALIRNIVGQTESSFSIREVMDEGKILIMNLSKGHIGEDSSALLGAMMITKIQLAAMSRVDIPEPERRDFYLYVDEFQNFATESFAGILSEARKYRLNLILAHQFMSQLDETVSDAVLGNVGTIVSFRVGALDTEILEKEFDPVFFASDLVNLDKYNIYLKLMIDGVSTRPFSAATLFPIDISKTAKHVDEVIAASRQIYARDKIEVEQRIMDWSGMKNPETVQNIKALAQQGSKGVKPNKNNNTSHSGNSYGAKKQGYTTSKKQNKKIVETKQGNVSADELGIGGLSGSVVEAGVGSIKQSTDNRTKAVGGNHSNTFKKSGNDVSAVAPPNIDDADKIVKKETTIVVCSGCSKETEINFTPDGIRPVFCQDCLKDYRREQSKLQQAKINKDEKKQVNSGGNSHGKSNPNNRTKTKENFGQTNGKSVNKGTIKVVHSKKKDVRTKIDSQAVQDLIKSAMDN